MSEGNKRRLHVEVVYALRDEQLLIALEVVEGATVRQAIERSGILPRLAESELAPGRVGIFGEQVELNRVLREGDRVEIYRPLVADPRQVRLQRARRSKTNSRR